MSDMLAVEQETNNDVRQFLNKINELRNKAPKNEETKHEEHTPDNHEETDHHEAKQQEQAWRGNLRYLDTLNRLDEVLPRKLYERWEKEHTVNDEAVLRALCYFAGTGKNSQLGWCRVGRGTIDKRARLSKNTVKNASIVWSTTSNLLSVLKAIYQDRQKGSATNTSYYSSRTT